MTRRPTKGLSSDRSTNAVEAVSLGITQQRPQKTYVFPGKSGIIFHTYENSILAVSSKSQLKPAYMMARDDYFVSDSKLRHAKIVSAETWCWLSYIWQWVYVLLCKESFFCCCWDDESWLHVQCRSHRGLSHESYAIRMLRQELRPWINVLGSTTV